MPISSESLDRFRRAVHETGLVVYTGAGVSRAAGLPAWDDLLRRLVGVVLGQEDDAGRATVARSQLADLAAGQLQPLVVARLVKDQLGAGLRPAIRDQFLSCLYPGHTAGSPAPARRLLEPRLAVPLLGAIAELVREARRAELLRGIVTYNYDDLLEAKLALEGIDCTPVLSPLRTPRAAVVPVYHVHGQIPMSAESEADREAEREVARAARLPEPDRDVFRRITFLGQRPADVAAAYGRPVRWADEACQRCLRRLALPPGPAADPEEDAGDNFVLSEDEYHREYAEPFRWSNVVQTSLLSRHASLFIGISLADPNHRRLIDLTQRAGSTAARLAVLSQPPLLDKAGRPSAELTQVLRRMDRLSLGKLDVDTVEVPGHDAVPAVVRQVAAAVA